MGLFRTLTCGGWTYVTSTDAHDWHDVFMISYLVATIPWTLGCIVLTPKANSKALYYRKWLAGSFFGTLIPLVYFFIQHKVHKVAGAYTIYAFFEWALVLFDVGFDACTAIDFESFELVIRDVQGASNGYVYWLPKYANVGSRFALYWMRADIFSTSNQPRLSDDLLEKEKDKPIGDIFGSGFSAPEALDAVADVYNGFVFWSMLTSLGLTVWYFPLWHMGISGWEIMCLSSAATLSLCSRSVRSFTINNVRYVHLASLTGLLGFLVVSPELRLTMVGFGVAMSCIAWSATWYAERSLPARLEARALAWVIGLIASSVAKFAFHTNNPIWPIVHAENGGWNKLGLFLAIPAILRSTRRVTDSRGGIDTFSTSPGSPVLAGLGLGGLTFCMHYLLSDSSTMVFWVWEGFPVRGPIAATGGILTLLFMAFGVAHYVVLQEEKATGPISFIILAIGAFLLTAYMNWLGYFGATMIALEAVSLTPGIIGGAVRSGPSSFGIGFLFYAIMTLASVWVVAYAFVPGGPPMREHTDWVVTAMVLSIGVGMFNAQRTMGKQKVRPKTRSHTGFNRLKSYYVYLLAGLELLAISISYLRFPTNDYQPHHKDDKLITAGIWTIHFSLDNDMWSSERRMRDLIKELEIDVIGLLETDLQRIIMGNRDTTQFLAEDLGMYVDYGPGPDKHTWGAALLSKFPILNSTHHLLPSPVGELAPAIHATLDAYGEHVDVVVFHSGQEEDPEDRRLQSEYLAKLMKESPRPLILLSYLVIKPGEGNYHTYVGEKSGMKDIDPSDWDRWCEYILYKGIKRSSYARVSRSTITDTELQVSFETKHCRAQYGLI